jgi:hypothetical protein
VQVERAIDGEFNRVDHRRYYRARER